MSGALAERVFAHKMKRVGFDNVQIVDRAPFSLEQAIQYPLFTPDLIELMRTLIPKEKRHQVAVAITATADKL